MATWYDLPAEIRQLILNYLFLKTPICHRRWRLRSCNKDILPIFVVSKGFANQHDIVNAIMTHANLTINPPNDISNLITSLPAIHLSKIRHLYLGDKFSRCTIDRLPSLRSMKFRFPQLDMVQMGEKWFTDYHSRLFLTLRPHSMLAGLAVGAAIKNKWGRVITSQAYARNFAEPFYNLEQEHIQSSVRLERAEWAVAEALVGRPWKPNSHLASLLVEAMRCGIEVKTSLDLWLTQPGGITEKGIYLNLYSMFSTKDMFLHFVLGNFHIRIPQKFDDHFMQEYGDNDDQHKSG